MLAVLIKPLVFLVVFGLIVLPIKLAVQKWLPEGRLKRALFREYWK